MSDRRALLVGINQFKNLPRTNWLNGCVNDANDMAKLLKDLRGFTDADITLLADAKATKANIMANLKKMVADAQGGGLKYLVFAMSSHGTQLPDTSGDEADHADEAFVPYDLAQKGDQWDPARVIIDDELHDLFVQLPKTAQLEVYLDTCHSGTGLKNMDPLQLLIPGAPRPRYLPPPSFEAFERVSKLPVHGLAKSLVSSKVFKSGNVLWAGCRADQTSADATFNSRSNGAFTYYYIQTIRTDPKLSRKQVAAKMRAALKKGKFDQIPQLETDATNRNRAAG